MKGTRYVAEGRLTVRHVDDLFVRASCKGIGQVYDLGHDAERGWWCTCDARTRCSHLHALALVVVRS